MEYGGARLIECFEGSLSHMKIHLAGGRALDDVCNSVILYCTKCYPCPTS